MLALRGGKVITACRDNPLIPWQLDRATVLVESGKIVAVGKDLTIPENARIIEADNAIVTPGFIDTHSHIGIMEEIVGWAGDDVNELTDPNTADVRVLDGINPADSQFEDARKGGVTCVQVGPGSGNVIGGEMLALKTCGTIVDDMVVRRPTGLKAALGENPKRVYGSKKKRPSTRMGNAAVLREALAKARDYGRKKSSEKPPDHDMRLEMLLKVLRKEMPLRIHAHRADDIMTAIRIKEEFDIDISVEHCTEGHKIADVLAEKQIPCAVGPSMLWRAKLECKEIGFLAPVVLSKAGVKLSIITDANVMPQHYLRIGCGLAVREGMSDKSAIDAVTLSAAEIIGIADRVGSIEPGKDADLVVWDGDPLEYLSHVRHTIIDGDVVYSRKEVR